MSENRDLWDSLRNCEKELKQARQQTIFEVFAEIDKYRMADPDCNCKTCRFYKKLKQKFRVDRK
jgi:hypothetical protein